MSASQSLSRTVGRAGWALADQAVSSGTNFALTAIVARESSASDFGAFALVTTLAITATAVNRGLANDPLSSRFAGASRRLQASAIGGAIATAFSVGLVGGAVAATTAWFVPSDAFSGALLALGLVLPGLLVQDTVRSSYLTAGSPRSAFLNDATWAALLALGCAVVLSQHAAHPATFVLVWGLGATVCAVFGCIRLSTPLNLAKIPEWLRKNSDLWPFYLVDNALFQVSNLILLLIITANAGLQDVAGLRAVMTLFGPVIVLAQATTLFVVPEISRRTHMTPRDIRRSAVYLGISLGIGVAIIGMCAFLLPDAVGRAVFGESWRYARPLLLFATADAVGAMFALGVVVGLRSMRKARENLHTRLWTLALRFVAASGGSTEAGARGAMAAAAAMAPISIALWYRTIWKITRLSTVEENDRQQRGGPH